MYSHGGMEMNSLLRLTAHHPPLGGGGNAVEDSKTSFENETESLYLTQLDSLNGLEAAVPAAMSSAWNSDLCDSLAQPRAMMMVRPEDVTGQKIAPKPEPMDQDDDVLAMIEANFDLSTLMTPMAESTVIEETQEAIDDMAQFLQTYEEPASASIKQELVEEEEPEDLETVQPAALPTCLADELLSLEQRQTLDQMERPQLSEEDLQDAEMLLDTLLGNSSQEEEEDTAATQQLSTDILQTAVDSEGLADSGFQTLLEETQPSSSRYSVANVSHCVTPDGKQVIIVVQRPAAEPAPVRKPRSSTTTDEDDDYDDPAWQPQQPQKRRPGRKREERVSLADAAAGSLQGVTKRSYKNIKDRKERKKIQNVEAARRYRDKKKQEQAEMEAEEAVQRAKNNRLKGQLKDIQSEVNTMKKLMKELGMLK